MFLQRRRSEFALSCISSKTADRPQRPLGLLGGGAQHWRWSKEGRTHVFSYPDFYGVAEMSCVLSTGTGTPEISNVFQRTHNMLALQQRTEDRSSAPDDDFKVKVGVLFFQFSIMINIAISRCSVHGAPKEVHRWVSSCVRQHSGTAATGADCDGSVTRGCIAFVQRAQKRRSLEPQSHIFLGQNLRCPKDMSGGQCLTQRDTCNSQRSQTQTATAPLQQQHEDPP